VGSAHLPPLLPAPAMGAWGPSTACWPAYMPSGPHCAAPYTWSQGPTAPVTPNIALTISEMLTQPQVGLQIDLVTPFERCNWPSSSVGQLNRDHSPMLCCTTLSCMLPSGQQAQTTYNSQHLQFCASISFSCSSLLMGVYDHCSRDGPACNECSWMDRCLTWCM